MGDQPTNATATVLCSDLVGSTELLAELGEMLFDEFRRAHFDVLRAAVGSHGGQEIKTLGDGILAVFTSAADAMSCAVAMQQAVDAAAGRLAGSPVSGADGLRGAAIRIGLALGDVAFEEDDVFGTPVVQASRLTASAGAGQILTTSVVPLVAGGRSTSTCVDLGPMTLKGMPEPVGVFEVTWPRRAAPVPGPAPDAPGPQGRGNLPAASTPFVGRRAEIEEVSAHLHQTRLLTVIGLGGAGKTRLATEVAAATADGYPDGTWLVELAPVGRPEGVAAAAGAAVGLDIGSIVNAASVTEALCAHLAGRRLLLVLDNCEHLVAASSEVAGALLRRCPGVTVLATSREVLRLDGEVVWSIPPLSMPAPGSSDADSLTGSDAVAMFCGRARAARPSFVLDAETAPAVARICRSLDGIPLALELAAARVRVLSVHQIADRLDDRFALLRGGSRLGSPHHQTLRAAMDWSHALLDPEEKLVLRRLSVFAGTFDLPAVEAVAGEGGRDDLDVLDALSRLIDKSLVVAVSGGSAERYRLLETVRHYGHDRLTEAGEVTATRRRHRDYYAGLARAWLEAPGDYWWAANDWPARAAADEDNFRVVLAAAAESGDTEAVLVIVAALWVLWLFSFRGDVLPWADLAVSATEGKPSPARIQAMCGLAFFLAYGEKVDVDRSAALLETACAEAEILADGQSVGCAYYISAEMALSRGDVETARAHVGSALQGYELAGAFLLIAYCERVLGWLDLAAGDAASARRHFETSLERSWHCDIATAHAASALAPMVARDGDRTRAGALATEAITRARRLPLRVIEAMALVQATKARILSEDLAGAARHAEDLTVLLERTGARSWLADALELCAVVVGMAGGRRACEPFLTDRHSAAGELFGASDAVRAARREQGLLDLAEESAAVRAAAAAALGPDGWAASTGRGAALSPAEALAAARAGVAAAVPDLTAEPAGRTAGTAPGFPAATAAALRRVGQQWEVTFDGRRVHVRDAKGMHDLAVLLAHPGVDIHVLDLASPDARLARAEPRGAPMLDEQALAAYRRRLAELDGEEAAAAGRSDAARLAALDAEREALRAELRSAAGLGGRPRALGGDAAERARKAVAARIRDSVRRISAGLPELGRHLERSLVTGTCCRYQPREPVTWTVSST